MLCILSEAKELPLLARAVRSPNRVVAHGGAGHGVDVVNHNHGFGAGVALGAAASPNYVVPEPYPVAPVACG